MDAWLESLVPWGTEVIVWAQSLSNSWLDSGFVVLTFLGYEQFYLFVLPLVYWSIHKETGLGLGFISLSSAWVNSVLKYLFAIPRPSDPRIHVPLPEVVPSFPSGHAQNAVVNWGYLAYRVRNPLFSLVSILPILGIGLSRVFLGVHYPQDVLGGWLIGLLLLVVYVQVGPPVGRWMARQAMGVQLALAVFLPIVLTLLHPADGQGNRFVEAATTPMAALSGLGVGAIMERSWVRFRVEGTWWRRAGRYLAGLVVVALFYLGPKVLLPQSLEHEPGVIVHYVRYGLLGWAVAFLAPWVFVKLHLAGQADA